MVNIQIILYLKQIEYLNIGQVYIRKIIRPSPFSVKSSSPFICTPFSFTTDIVAPWFSIQWVMSRNKQFIYEKIIHFIDFNPP